MIIINPLCKLISRDDLYFVLNKQTHKCYQINKSQYEFICLYFCCRNEITDYTMYPDGSMALVQQLLSLGILIDSSAAASQYSKRKRFVYTDIFHFRLYILDPNLLCTKLLTKGKFIFNRFVVVMLFVCSLLIIPYIMVWWQQIPNEQQSVTLPSYILMIYFATVIPSIGHEFSHALICKSFGGDVNEMGIAFLYLSPCFYCNITDSYLFKQKRHLVMVALIGIVYDIVIIVAMFLLMNFGLKLPYTHIKEYLRYSVVMLLFELNPLLKHDGYYVLTEILSIYNLREKAFHSLTNKLLERDNSSTDRSCIYWIYGLFSSIYLVFHLYILFASFVHVFRLITL